MKKRGQINLFVNKITLLQNDGTIVVQETCPLLHRHYSTKLACCIKKLIKTEAINIF